MNKVWLITGCSTGFGRNLAIEALKKGYSVAVTARKITDIEDIIKGYESQAIALQLDVTKAAEIKEAVEQTIAAFGRIDVLVNNAGIGYFAAMEESEDAEVRKMFDINVFGLGDMTNAVLPKMRQQKSGHVVNIASIGGFVGFPSVGYYNATKFAVVGMSEALAKEVKDFGIKVTIIAPSGFRTDWAGRSAKDSENKIGDYADTAAAKNQANIRGYSGNQPGDPQLAALAIIKAVEAENPPLHLLLGKNALNGALQQLEILKTDFDTWAETTVGADRPLG